jgi:hypothetical protein
VSETKHVHFGEAKQKELDNVVRKLAQERKAAVEAELDRRLTYRDEGKVQWQAYARFLLSDGHTIYVNLRTMEGKVSKEVDKFAQGKVAKREAKAAKRAEKKAAREAKKASVPAVKFDPKAPTLETTPSKKRIKLTEADLAAIAAIVEERSCTRANALKIFNKRKAAK